MRGTIRQRSKGSWQLIFDMGRDESGRRRQKFITVRGTKADAERKLRQYLTSAESGDLVQPSRQTLAEFLHDWMNEYVRPNLAPKTVEGYEHMIRRHLVPGLGAIRLDRLTPQHIQRYYAMKTESGDLRGKGGLSARTVRHHHRTLHDALHHAVKWGLIARNPASATEPPRFKAGGIRAITPQGVSRLLTAAEHSPYYPLFYLALFTGMRRSELLGLRWRDLDLDFLTVSVVQVMHRLRGGVVVFREPKSQKSRRSIDLPPTAAAVLRSWQAEVERQKQALGNDLDGDTLVFCHADGSPWQPDSVTHAFMKLARQCQLPGTRLHDLRHTHATLMLKQGIHPKIVQERLGHASIQLTLDTYSHVVPGLQRAAALRFDEGLFGTTDDGPEVAKMLPFTEKTPSGSVR